MGASQSVHHNRHRESAPTRARIRHMIASMCSMCLCGHHNPRANGRDDSSLAADRQVCERPTSGARVRTSWRPKWRRRSNRVNPASAVCRCGSTALPTEHAAVTATQLNPPERTNTESSSPARSLADHHEMILASAVTTNGQNTSSTLQGSESLKAVTPLRIQALDAAVHVVRQLLLAESSKTNTDHQQRGHPDMPLAQMEDISHSTPRSARNKKKSALSRLAERHHAQSDDSDASSTHRDSRSHSSSTDRARYSQRSTSGISGSGLRGQYPIDADVHVQQQGAVEEDSDEGISLGPRRSPPSNPSFSERFGNQHYDTPSSLQEMESDSDKEGNVKSNGQTHQSSLLPDSEEDTPSQHISSKFSSHSRTNQYLNDDDASSEGNVSDDHSPPRNFNTSRQFPPSPLSDTLRQEEEMQNQYRQILASHEEGQDIGPDHRLQNHNRTSESGWEGFGSGPKPSTLSPVPRKPKKLEGSFKYPSSSLYQSYLKDSEMNETMTDDTMSTTSVLPLISTKEARNRSYLVGSMNSSGSMLGSEELKRFFPEGKIRIFAGTWNMGGMKNPPNLIDDFLLPESDPYMHDVYAIGTQESTANRSEWGLALQETLGPQMVLFHSAVFGELYLHIFLRRDLIWYCSVTEEANVSTRPGPTGHKTKGGQGVCFTMFGTSFLFINSHFSPHDGRINNRIADYNKICAELALPQKLPAVKGTANNEDVTSRFDCVFWMGDLNFRIEKERERVEYKIRGLAEQEIPSYEELLCHDELTRAQTEGKAFQPFLEGKIRFLPTYKFDIGTGTYDTSPKMRIPSYTDRILFRSRQKGNMYCVTYGSAHEVKESDHRPVYGVYEATLRPGRDNIPLSGGKFNKEVWLEGNQRRADRVDRNKIQKPSKICSIQ